MNKKIAAVVALVLAITVSWQLHQKQNRDAANAGTKSDSAVTGDINVFAASSLTETFTMLGKEYEASHPGVKVNFTFGSSSTLAQQIVAGAPVDVFASASKKSMDSAGDRMITKADFVMNHVVVAYKAKDQSSIPAGTTAAQLLNGSSVWIQCAHEAPCGAAADKAITAEGVTTQPKSLEPDVKSVLAKLLAGEVDFAIVYHTDVVAHSELSEVEFVDKTAAVTDYSIGQVQGSNPATSDFLTYLKSPHALELYSKAGFGIPGQ